MIGFDLTPEQAMLRDTARAFAAERVRPVAKALRRETLPEPWPIVEPVFRAGAALGFTRVLLPEAYGGLGQSCLDACLLLEEIGAADVAIAGDLFALSATLPLMLARFGTDEQKARLLPQFASERGFLAAGAQSEPDVGGSEIMFQGDDPARGPRAHARRTADGYVLNGRKSAFITNAGAAEGYVVMARTALDAPVSRTLTAFWIPRGAPGLSVGPRTALIGWHGSSHAPLYLDDVAVPDRDRIGAEGQAGMMFALCPEMPVCLAACFVGLARAAYEYALDYARTRISNGVPVIEHQAVALKLADAAVQTRAARLLVWDAAATCATDPMAAAAIKAPAAKTAAVDAAIRNAERAVQILGGYGVTREYEAGGMLADAWIGYACDFTRDVLRLGMVPFLTPEGAS